MTDLTWGEFQKDKEKAEQQVNLILSDFAEKYNLGGFEMHRFDWIEQESNSDISIRHIKYKLEVKI